MAKKVKEEKSPGLDDILFKCHVTPAPRHSGAGAPTLLAMTDKGMPHHNPLVSTEIREVP